MCVVFICSGGSVICVFEPHFDGSAELRLETPEFRNTHNAFDTLGSALGGQIVAVSCSQHHAAAVTKKGSLFTWGNNHEGQLGRLRKHNICEITCKKMISSYAHDVNVVCVLVVAACVRLCVRVSMWMMYGICTCV